MILNHHSPQDYLVTLISIIHLETNGEWRPVSSKQHIHLPIARRRTGTCEQQNCIAAANCSFGDDNIESHLSYMFLIKTFRLHSEVEQKMVTCFAMQPQGHRAHARYLKITLYSNSPSNHAIVSVCFQPTNVMALPLLLLGNLGIVEIPV